VTPSASAGRYFELAAEHGIGYPSYYPNEFKGKEKRIACVNELYVLVRIGFNKSYVDPVVFFKRGLHPEHYGDRVNVQLHLHEGVYMQNICNNDKTKFAKICLEHQVADKLQSDRAKEATNRMVQGYRDETDACKKISFAAISPRPANTNFLGYVQWCIRNGEDVNKDGSKLAYMLAATAKRDDEVLSVAYTIAPSLPENGQTWEEHWAQFDVATTDRDDTSDEYVFDDHPTIVDDGRSAGVCDEEPLLEPLADEPRIETDLLPEDAELGCADEAETLPDAIVDEHAATLCSSWIGTEVEGWVLRKDCKQFHTVKLCDKKKTATFNVRHLCGRTVADVEKLVKFVSTKTNLEHDWELRLTDLAESE